MFLKAFLTFLACELRQGSIFLFFVDKREREVVINATRKKYTVSC